MTLKNDELELSDQKKMILKEFRNAVSDILKPEHNDDFLLKWLISRDFDLRVTEKMIRESFKFKKKIGAEDLIKSGYKLPELIKEYVLTKYVGVDSEGCPVRVFLTGICDVKGIANSYSIVELLRVVVYEMEFDLKKAAENGHPYAKALYLIDLHGLHIRGFLDRLVINYGIQLLSLYQNSYPEMLKKVFIINAPSSFVLMFKVFKPFIHENTLKKIEFFGTSNKWRDEVFQTVDPNILPQYFGGTVEDPGYDPRIRLLMKTTKVPLKHYRKAQLSLNPTDPDVNTVTIRERTSFNYEINVEEPDTVIRWEFQTKDYNIKFGVFYTSSINMGLKIPPEELLPTESVESQILPEVGKIICEKPGQYTLHFDNSYSWLTGKQLIYKFEQIPPKRENSESNPL